MPAEGQEPDPAGPSLQVREEDPPLGIDGENVENAFSTLVVPHLGQDISLKPELESLISSNLVEHSLQTNS